jgi:uncharacterized protein (DUF1330 family)
LSDAQEKEEKMPAYLVYAITEVTDQEKSAEYLRQLPPVLRQFGAEPLFQRREVHPISGAWKPQLLTLFKFESLDRIREFFESEEYAPLNELRLASRIDDMVAVETED